MGRILMAIIFAQLNYALFGLLDLGTFLGAIDESFGGGTLESDSVRRKSRNVVSQSMFFAS